MKLRVLLLRIFCLGIIIFGLWWDRQFKAENDDKPHELINRNGILSRTWQCSVILSFGGALSVLIWTACKRRDG